MKTESTSIICPECKTEIDINQTLYHQLQDEIRSEFNLKLAEAKKGIETQTTALQEERSVFEQQKSDLEKSIQQGVNARLSKEKLRIQKEIREEIIQEKSDELLSYQTQLQEKSNELKEFNHLKAEHEKVKRAMSEISSKLQAESEQKLTELVTEARSNIRKELEEQSQLKITEKQVIIDQLQNQLQQAQRKAQEGSTQIRGESLELAIEEFLRDAFPLDQVEEVGKGVRGADCIHIINTHSRKNCGSIIYECKRTKDFQPSWVEKLKQNMRANANCTFGVIVTEAMPKGADHIHQRDGIWITTFADLKGLTLLLREAVIMLSSVKDAQDGKSGKMELLYEFMTGNEFRMQIEAIVEGFSDMQASLLQERRAMEALWKQRSHQIEKVLLNTTHIYSSVKGIAGNAIQSIKLLEFPSTDDNLKLLK